MSQTDFMSAIRQIAAERKIDITEIVEAIKEALVASFRNAYISEEAQNRLSSEIDPDKGHIAVYMKKDIVDTVTDKDIQISLSDAKELSPKAKVGSQILVDITSRGDFGRIAAQAARQIIMQKLTEAEKNAVLTQFKDKVGSIISVFVQRVTKEGDVICEVSKAKAVMPKSERIATEFYKTGSSIKVLLKSIDEDAKGKFMLVSRSDPDFLRALFAMEVPEIESGTVEIVSIAREAGSRSKVAVRSLAEGIDPIGACVGQKGVRINSISNELKIGAIEEKIDIILWDEEIERYIMNSIRPADSIKVEITDAKSKKAKVIVPDDKLSLAIGREGQNARLSAKLTGWTLDIESESGKSHEDIEEEKKEVEETSETTESVEAEE